jgi:hypothetical protein
MSITKLECDPPRPASRNRPLVSTGATQSVEADRGKPDQVFEAFGLVEKSQPAPG